MFVWYWVQDPDPALMLGVPTKGQIGAWSDTYWWTPEYDALNAEQLRTLDVQKRIALAQQQQQIVWEASPYLIFSYPFEMEAYNHDTWQGVVTSPADIEDYDGAAFFNYINIDTYRFVTTKTASTGSDGGADTTVLTIVGVVVAIVVAGGIALVVRRRRRRSVEE
jgi:LPXTG-motif cell wall-anchored protein